MGLKERGSKSQVPSSKEGIPKKAKKSYLCILYNQLIMTLAWNLELETSIPQSPLLLGHVFR